jgi:uncharacterized protein YndB with AHSA1/START domain
MTHVNPNLDLTISRVIRAPRQAIWQAWSTPSQLEQWWVPAPARCRVEALDLRPGGAFVTRYSEDGEDFAPHVSGCFLDVVAGERIVFTDALLEGWRPSEAPFMTAVITLRITWTARSTPPTSCTGARPTATTMRRWASSTAGAP